MVNTPHIQTRKPHLSNHHFRSLSHGSSNATTMSSKPLKCSVLLDVPLNRVLWLQPLCPPGLGLQLSCKVPPWLTSTAFRDLSGMLPERRFRFCYSPVLRLNLRDAPRMLTLSLRSSRPDSELLRICKSGQYLKSVFKSDIAKGFHCVRHHDQYSRDRYVVDRRCCCHQLPHWYGEFPTLLQFRNRSNRITRTLLQLVSYFRLVLSSTPCSVVSRQPSSQTTFTL